MTTIDVAGTGPAADALLAALADTDTEVRHEDELDFEGADLAVLVERVASDRFARATDRARAVGTPWVAVELGGIGGVPVVDAAVSGFAPETGCFDCLSTRVAANVAEQEAPAQAPSPGVQRFVGALAGHRIEQFLAGEAALPGTVTEVPHAQRQFLPVPGCDCAGAPDRTLRRDHDAPDDPALARAQQGLDERVGVVHEVGEAESFPAPYYLATLADTSGFSDATAPRQAAGVADDWNAAFMKGLGESYERYAAAVYRSASLPTGPPERIENPVLPTRFVRPDGWAWDGESIEWYPAERLETGEGVHLPAETVLYPPPSRRVRPPVTTGLGLGNTGTEALLSGLYEVVERDAAMLSWYSTYDPLAVAVEGHDTFETLRRRARSEDLDVTTLLLTQDVDVPVVAVALSGDEWPALALGSAAALDPVDAATGALEEALQNWMELDGMGPEGAQASDGAIGHFAQRPDAAASFLETETTVPIDSVGPDTIPEGEAELTALVDRVTAADFDPYGARITTRDVEALGFEAVRVVCPTAQPLFFDDAFFGERAERVPEAMGFEARLDREHHPFP
ncbi:YcaO-like family protein [Halomicroarcula sp. GCM10025817]|uniref:YcaO-like family protein n=1 Tax=Haloarcula TaxID=2237 RepID=UPI0023E834A2|nr:YcaO-like family protein [Halomicroarcula sp. SYNS111]